MAFGARFLNQYSRVQIDDTMPVMSLMQSGTATANQNIFDSPTTRYIVLTFSNCYAPMLAIGVDEPAAYEKAFQVIKIQNSGSTWSFTVAIWHGGNSDFGFRWYLYDIPYNTTPSGYTFIIRDSLGRIIFNMNRAPMKVANSLVAGRTYAAINYGQFAYSESYDYDTMLQQDIVTWELYIAPCSTYPNAGYINGFVAGGQGFQPPTINWPYSSTAQPDPFIFIDVTYT